MNNLREQLAKRLGAVLEPYGDRLLDRDDWIAGLADECIRQMEWSRLHHAKRPPIEEIYVHNANILCSCGQILFHREAGFEHWMAGHFDRGGDLTLAPEDWQP